MTTKSNRFSFFFPIRSTLECTFLLGRDVETVKDPVQHLREENDKSEKVKSFLLLLLSASLVQFVGADQTGSLEPNRVLHY